MLHASRLQFNHPLTGAVIDIRADVDDVWQRVMTTFNWSPSLLLGA
jgi:tRNA pseudouridine65 synthase